MLSGMDGYYKKSNELNVYSLMAQLSTKTFFAISLQILIFILVLEIDDLTYKGKVSLIAFLFAMVYWITTKIPAGFVAMAAIVCIILMRAADEELLYQALAQEVVWLMIGAFIIGEAVKNSGLGDRLCQFIMNKANKKGNLLFALAQILLVSAFFIPSTSGRAALSLPIVRQISKGFHIEEKRALAIIVPVVILMSTSATLIGAGSHLIGVALLESTTNQSISYVQWLVWGVPFTLIVTLSTYLIAKWLLWPKSTEEEEVHSYSVDHTTRSKKPMDEKEKRALTLIAVLTLGWMTQGLHGYDIGFVTIMGALLFMAPSYGVISWGQGIKSVSWHLIVFVAAATAMGNVLVDTGVVEWMEGEMISVLHLFENAPEWVIIFVILLVTVTSHLYIHSHTTRAVIFIPSLIVFSETMGFSPSAVVFLSLVGMNYCLTFPVSSKALLIYYEEDELSFDAEKLFKLSFVLMLPYILLMMIFYFTYWKWTGMHL
ncbi:SLC13 family permease [Halobacillus hunanensis]|uniref:SLC13 family permease n=1 Tax=Halobacillus hunanensis TaxID=578214 RepID=UPI0009A83D1D|nr:SLC13 family permease [Halobacillus hunanensis]